LEPAGKSQIRNPKHLPARSRFGEGRRNPKGFDKLTTMSHVEGQYRMIQIQMTETVVCRVCFEHWNFPALKSVSNFGFRDSDLFCSSWIGTRREVNSWN
jgi:hypothetical protein